LARLAGRKLTRRERITPHDPDNTAKRIVNEMIRNKVPTEEARKKLGKWPRSWDEEPKKENLFDSKVRDRMAREFARLGRLYPKKVMTLEEYAGKLEKAYVDKARKEYPGDAQEEEDAKEEAKFHTEYDTKRAKAFGTPSRGKPIWRYKDWRYPTEKEKEYGPNEEKVSLGRIAVGAKKKRVRYYKFANPDKKLLELEKKYEDMLIQRKGNYPNLAKENELFSTLQGNRFFPKFTKHYMEVRAGIKKSKVVAEEEKKIMAEKIQLEPHIIDFLNSAGFGGDITDVMEGKPAPVSNLLGSHLTGVLLRRAVRGEEAEEIIRKFAKEALPNEPPFVHALVAKKFAEQHGNTANMLIQTFPDYHRFVMQKWESERNKK